MVRPEFPFQNLLLGALTPDERAALSGHLQPLDLPVDLSLERSGRAVERVCFPETGMISVVAQGGRERIEVGLIGYEGMSGASVILSDGRAANDAYMQIGGHGHCIDAGALCAVMDGRPSILKGLLPYFYVMSVQIAQTALSNGRFAISHRLARWLLMASDRMRCDELVITHEFLSVMLGVRRPGVTDALHQLEGDHMIRSTRGRIVLLDRAAMIDMAGGSYGVSEGEYARLYPAATKA